MAKTLSESAAEILNASMKAGKEPMAKSQAEVQDLGGATTDNPGGNEIGKEVAAAAAEALNKAIDTQNELLELNQADTNRRNKVELAELKAQGKEKFIEMIYTKEVIK